jgi:hypothetical protein
MIKSPFLVHAQDGIRTCTRTGVPFEDRRKAGTWWSIDLDLDLVAVGIADEGREAFASGTVVDLGLGGLQAFAFEGGDDVVNA